MRLTKVYIRFYKSFNFDYERKFDPKAKPEPWELIDGAWFPYVRIALDNPITTVVGANESGKSHLLDAIEALLGSRQIERSDFCRYSGFFSVERGHIRVPDIGGEFEVTTSEDATLLKEALGVSLSTGSRFLLLRPDGADPVVYLPRQTKETRPQGSALEALGSLLPSTFRLKEKLGLPATIPIRLLAAGAREARGDRRSRHTILEKLLGGNVGSEEDVKKLASDLFGAVTAQSTGLAPTAQAEYDLGRELLFTVARIDQKAILDLDEAIADGNEGYANAVVQKVNDALRRHLNFPKWWAQDRDFRLTVSARETDLVFTVRDRTGTDYSYAERSEGLKYFLSYYVQLLAHPSPEPRRPEILLMDEPDAYLSSQGQQDLLRILEDFAAPEAGPRDRQVVYVTHSPYLINRNAAARIRVLDKGSGDEGTRVVRDPSRNHYEPLRSSLGQFVAETAFIGGSNLFVEGVADQVLLAGMSSHLAAIGDPRSHRLDLNVVTIVPAGAASDIPYMVYLARGRDQIRPPCVALFDGDDEGRKHAGLMRADPVRGKRVLDARFVIELGAWATAAGGRLRVADGVQVRELEDLVALPVVVAACRSYARDFLALKESEVASLHVDDISAALEAKDGSVWDATKATFKSVFERIAPGAHIEKVGFARAVIQQVIESRGKPSGAVGVPDTVANFRAVLTDLGEALRLAVQIEEADRRDDRLKRFVKAFADDHPLGASRDDARLLLVEVEGALGDGPGSDDVRGDVTSIRTQFRLEEGLTEPVQSYDRFLDAIKGLPYRARLASQRAAGQATGDSADEEPVEALKVAKEGSPGRGGRSSSTSTSTPAQERSSSGRRQRAEPHTSR